MLQLGICALLLIGVIKVVVGEDVSIASAFLASVVAAVVSLFLMAIACAPIESVWLSVIVAALISMVVTGIVVQFLCSTDLKRVILVATIFTAIQFAVSIGIELATN